MHAFKGFNTKTTRPIGLEIFLFVNLKFIQTSCTISQLNKTR